MGWGAYHITIRLLLDEHGGDKERQHLRLAKDLVTEIRAAISEGQSPTHGFPTIVTDIDFSSDIDPGPSPRVHNAASAQTRCVCSDTGRFCPAHPDAPLHTCEIGVPDAGHPLRTDSAHCAGCADGAS